jgi:hypothetical protein
MRCLLLSLSAIAFCGVATANEPPRPTVQKDAKCTASAYQLRSYEVPGSERYKGADALVKLSRVGLLVFVQSSDEEANAMEWAREEVQTMIAGKSDADAKEELRKLLVECPAAKALQKNAKGAQ